LGPGWPGVGSQNRKEELVALECSKDGPLVRQLLLLCGNRGVGGQENLAGRSSEQKDLNPSIDTDVVGEGEVRRDRQMTCHYLLVGS